eukprot:COSAG01_NODE_2764_length_7112_cov_593.144018_7_plen_340_part_00
MVGTRRSRPAGFSSSQHQPAARPDDAGRGQAAQAGEVHLAARGGDLSPPGRSAAERAATVLWFHTAQLRRAQQLGFQVPIAEGPTPYGDFEVPETMEGLFIDPEATYLRRCRQVRQTCRQLRRIEQGYRFDAGDIEGGRQGVSYGPEARRLPFRHLVFENVAGRPRIVREQLPDGNTQMRLGALAKLCLAAGATDQYAWSELVLYGMRSLPACTPATHSWLLYSGAYDQLQFLQDNRVTQREQGCISAPFLGPRFEPERRHPKSVDVHEKLDGSIKLRETTDYGAWRVRRRWTSFKLRTRLRHTRPRWGARRIHARTTIKCWRHTARPTPLPHVRWSGW